MKTFNLEEAKAGKPVMTNNGQNVRIISFDRKSEDFPIVALISLDFCEIVECFTKEGIPFAKSNMRLMMKPEKITLWANVYKSKYGRFNIGQTNLHLDKETAVGSIFPDNGYIDTVKIEVEV